MACLASALLGAGAYRYLGTRLGGRAPLVVEEAPAGPVGPYSGNLVDRLGGTLSRRQGHIKFALDPWTTYRNLPNQKLPYLTIDANGYRVADPSPVGGRKTIVILGGSAAFGQGLASDAETFAAQLAQKAPAFHVVNAAAVGFVSGQELAEMVHYADRLRPALYVVFDGWNERHAQSDGAAGYGLGYNWQMVQQIEDQLRKAVHGEAAKREPFHPSPTEVADAYVANLERMQAFATGRGAEVLFVFQPHLSAALDREGRFTEWRKKWNPAGFDAEYSDMIARAVRAATERAWNHLDMSGALPSPDLFIDPVHPNAAGHARIAELLAPIFAGADRR